MVYDRINFRTGKISESRLENTWIRCCCSNHFSFKTCFGEVLAGLLGFITGKEYGSGLHITPPIWNLGWSNSSMYVYSPIADSTIVGDVTAPLLLLVLIEHTLVRVIRRTLNVLTTYIHVSPRFNIYLFIMLLVN